MKAYYQDDYVTLYCGDCLEIMPQLDMKFDLCLTDPPYVQDSHGGGGAFGCRMRDYHKGVDSLGYGFENKVLSEAIKLLDKVHFYVFCSKNQLIQILLFFEKYNYDILAYHKTNPTPTCNNKYLPDTEYIVFVREKGVLLFGTYSTKKKYFIQENAKNDFNHPTVKPLNIIGTLLGNSTKDDDIILDPFAGSGTTGRACKDLHRKCVLIEKEEKYCKIIVDRMSQEVLTF